MCHETSELVRVRQEEAQARDHEVFLSTADRVARIGGLADVGLLATARSAAASAIHAALRGKDSTDAAVREALFDLRQSKPYLFSTGGGEPSKKGVAGYTLEQLKKMDPRKRLGIVNGEKGPRL